MSRLQVAFDRLDRIPPGRRGLLVWLLLGLFAANALLAAALNSGACDELGAHIPCGYLFWKSGQFSGGIDNFPLGQLWIALPAAVLGVDYTLWTEQHLILFRLPVIALGVLTCWLVYRLAESLLGEGAALGALFLAALCPNLLAHGSLATLDLPATFGVLLTVYCLMRYVQEPRFPRMAAVSLALAAGSLVKVQALLLYPYAALILLVAADRSFSPKDRSRPTTLLSWAMIPAAWFLMTNLVYLHLPGSGGSLLPPLYISALEGLKEHSRQGHFAYLAGKYSQGGWWYFFPAAIFFKTPLALLVSFFAGLIRRWSVHGALFLLAPIALFLGAAMTSRINIGLRHVLPIYPFLAVVAGLGIARLWNLTGRARAWSRPTVLLLLAGYAFHAATIAPHYLSYFNLLAGGPKNGHRFLIDSNYDWGTNDRFLRRHVERRGGAYQIDPYAFRGTNGPILVNANALYGVLNGREKAYEWLRRFQPVRRIAYTWFEYEVPAGTFPQPVDDEEARMQVIGHLDRLRAAGATVDHPGYGTILGRAFAEVGAYDLAFARLRDVVRRHPDYAPALTLGGELIIRWKLGILIFRGREYLDGFRTPPPDARAAGELERTVALARRAGMAANLARAEAELGLTLEESGDSRAAVDRYQSALRLDPGNAAARQALSRMGAGG